MYLAILTIVLALLPAFRPYAIVSIDLGSQYVKNGIIRSGYHAEVVYDDEGRKFATAVSFASTPPKIGDSAVRATPKQPNATFTLFPGLLSTDKHPIETNEFQQLWQSLHPKASFNGENRTFGDDLDGDVHYLEECLAMMIQYSLKRCRHFDGKNHLIDTAVLLQSEKWTYADRSLLISLANLFNLNVTAIIPGNLAAAFGYGLFNTNDFRRHPMVMAVIDIGSTGVRASLFELSFRKLDGKAENIPSIITLGHAHDRGLGALHIQMLIRDSLVDQINRKVPFEPNPRTMYKLKGLSEQILKRLASERVVRLMAENIYKGVDVEFEITQEDFKANSNALLLKAESLIRTLLANSNVSAERISQVTPIGGGSRIPILEEAICKALNRTRFDRRINADEGATLGATYYGAALSSYFQTKKFTVKDLLTFSVRLEIEGGNQSNRSSLTVFDFGMLYPRRRAVTLRNRVEDFRVNILIFENGNLTTPSQTQILRVNGIKKVQSALPTGSQHFGVKVYFLVDETQQLVVEKVEYRARVPKSDSTFEGIRNRLWRKLGLDKGDAMNATTPENESLSVVNETSTQTNDTANNSTLKKASNVTEKTFLQVSELPFEFINSAPSFYPTFGDRLADIRDRLQKYAEEEKRKLELERLQNDLEALLYEWTANLADLEIVQYMKPAELSELTRVLAEKRAWFDDHAFSSGLEILREHFGQLVNLIQPITRRRNEHKVLAQSIAGLQRAINNSDSFVTRSDNLTEIADAQNVTNTSTPTVRKKPLLKWELDLLSEKLNDTKEWFSEMSRRQQALPANEDPVLLSADLARRQDELVRETDFLSRKVRYFVYPRSLPTVNVSSNESTTLSKNDSQKLEEPRNDSAAPTIGDTNVTEPVLNDSRARDEL